MKIEIAKFQDGYYYVVDGVKQNKVEEELFKLFDISPQEGKITVNRGEMEYDHKPDKFKSGHMELLSKKIENNRPSSKTIWI